MSAVTPDPAAEKADTAPVSPYQQLTVMVQRVARAAQAAGRPAGVALLRSGLATATRTAIRVVVAGETATGKSRLINALVGRPGIAPVGVGETTACPIVFRHGTADSAVAHLTDPATGATVVSPIGLAELALHAVADAQRPAVLIEVFLTSPLLESMELVDTPGVGGLSSGHSRLSTQLLHDADALLFAFDTSAPMLAPELRFLAAAAEIVANIVIVATKVDAAPRYPEVIAETSRSLAARPRLSTVPVVPVSAELAERAADLPPRYGSRLVEMSGVPVVADLLRGFGERTTRVRWANLARRTASVATELAAAHRGAAGGDQAGTDALDAEDARLADLLAAEPSTRIALTHLFQRLRSEPKQDFEDAATALRHVHQATVVDGDRAALEALPVRLEGDLAAAAAAALAGQDRLVAELVATLGERLDAVDVGERLTAGLGLTGAADLGHPQAGGPLQMRGQSLAEVSGGLRIGKVAVLAAYHASAAGPLGIALGVAAGPVGWVVGGAAGLGVLAAMLVRIKLLKTHQLRVHLRGWTDQTINEGRQAAGRELDRRAQAVQRHVEAALPDWLADLRARRKDITARRAAGTRAAAGQPVGTTVHDELDKLAARADAFAGRLSSTTTVTRREPPEEQS